MNFLARYKKQKTFHQLYLENQEFLRASLFWIGPQEKVDDLLQETFVRAWNHWEGFEGKSSTKTWLYRIAMNLAKDAFKKRDVLDLGAEGSAVEGLSNEGKSSDLNLDLKKALEELSFEQREVLSLSYYWGYTIKEIALLTERPEGTVKTQVHHGKLKLGQLLKEDFDEG